MQKYCKDCDKKITKGSKLGKCKSCSKKGRSINKGKDNYFYKDGKCLKFYFCKCGKKLSDYRHKICKKCFQKSNTKYDISKEKLIKEYIKNKKSTIEIARLLNCGSRTIRRNLIKYNIPRRKSSYYHIGKSYPNCCGKNSHFYGKIYHGKHEKYKGIWMRSSWEINFAQFLTLSNIKWLYESKTFDLGDTTYTPDFYISEWDLYIEVKGWWRDDAKIKFEKFCKLYKNIKIEVLMKTELQTLGILQ